MVDAVQRSRCSTTWSRRVEVSNQNLAASEAAYRQALAVVREQRASLFPSIDANAGVTKSGGGARGGGTVVTTPGGSVSRTSSGNGEIYQAGGSASWEIDLWGALARARSRTRTRSLMRAPVISSSPSCPCRRSSRPPICNCARKMRSCGCSTTRSPRISARFRLRRIGTTSAWL